MSEFLLPLPVILAGWALAVGSPGPATLAISGTSMEHGRRAGFALVAGVLGGSMSWGLAAALGFSALMTANVWMFETVRIAGTAYLFYLALKSLRSAWLGAGVAGVAAPRRGFFLRGLMLHLTNPKAVLAWGSIYAIALRPDAGIVSVWTLFAALFATSVTILLIYVMVFSSSVMARGYRRLKRWFDLSFGLLFGAASLKLLTLRVS